MRFKARLLSLWESIRASYWFVPSLMSIGALVLSFAMVWLDRAVPSDWLAMMPWLYTGTADGARTLLAAIASSMIGLAGVVFSITIVSLTLASGQFGPRLLRNFMRDTGNQVTLGTFLAAFLYCLLILRKVHGGTDEGGDVFVPQLSMLVAVLSAVAGLGVLIYFIHHAAASIQAPNVIASVSEELSAAIETLYPERLGEGPTATPSVSEGDARSQVPERFVEDSAEVRAGCDGYVQRIEADQLFDVASEHGLVLRMEHRPGQFVQRDNVILRVWPRGQGEAEILDALRQTFTIGDHRSAAQDAEFAIEQLVEIATRALSPGINDPFTAIQCVDRLGAALSELASRQIPSPYRMDESGHLRVLAYPKTFGDFLDTSFNQIRQYASGSLDVLLRMLEAMGRIGRSIRSADDRRCLEEHAEMVYELALATAKPERDRRQAERRLAGVRAAALIRSN